MSEYWYYVKKYWISRVFVYKTVGPIIAFTPVYTGMNGIHILLDLPDVNRYTVKNTKFHGLSFFKTIEPLTFTPVLYWCKRNKILVYSRKSYSHRSIKIVDYVYFIIYSYIAHSPWFPSISRRRALTWLVMVVDKIKSFIGVRAEGPAIKSGRSFMTAWAPLQIWRKYFVLTSETIPMIFTLWKIWLICSERWSM